MLISSNITFCSCLSVRNSAVNVPSQREKYILVYWLLTSGILNPSHLNFFRCNNSFLDESFSIFVQNMWCVLYFTVHQRLSEHRFIDFIVAITSVAHLKIGKRFWKYENTRSCTINALMCVTLWFGNASRRMPKWKCSPSVCRSLMWQQRALFFT